MSSGILSIGLSGLVAAQAGLRTAGNNIANVNTPGYSRQEVLFAQRPTQQVVGGFLGQGVDVTTVRRHYAEFLAAQTTRATADASQLEAYSGQLDQLDNVLGDATTGLSPAIGGFFTAVNAVAAHPADVPSRQALLSAAQSLTTRFNQLDNQMSEMRTQSNAQLQSGVATINGYTSQIALLNRQIALASLDPQQAPNDLLDRRDLLVTQLNAQVGANVVTQSDGSYNVFLNSGQALVVGQQANTLSTRTNPDDPANLEITMQQGASVLRLGAMDFSGGAMGGAVAFRDGPLDGAQDALGRIAVALGAAVNAQNRQGVDLNGVPGGDIFRVPAPVVRIAGTNTGTGAITATIADASALAASDYRLGFDGANYQLTRLADGTTQSFASLPQTVDGIAITGAGAPATGDHFLIQATHYAAGTLGMVMADPALIAAATPIRTGIVLGNAGTGQISAGSVDATYPAAPLAGTATLTYASGTGTLSGFPAVPVSVTVNGSTTVYPAATPVPYTAGATIAFGGMTVVISGTPANGDKFTLAPNTSGTGDGRNAQALASLAAANTVAGKTTTFAGAYGQLVAANGNATKEAGVERDSQNALLAQSTSAQQTISGVNLDEEAADLQRFQQAYQAAAKMMAVAASLFDSVLAIAKG